MAARIEAAGPSPWIFAGRDADALGDRADAHVIIEDLPALFAGT
jgi:hypothetical protein